MTTPSPSRMPRHVAPFTIRFTVDAAGEHRWAKIARNHRTVGASTEGYTDPRDAIDNLLDGMPGYEKVDGGLLNELLDDDDPARFIPIEVRR